MTRPLRVFLCHSSNDKPAVRELYQKLCAEPWIQPWLAGCRRGLQFARNETANRLKKPEQAHLKQAIT